MENETLYIYVRDSMDNMESLDTQKKKGIELSKKLGMDYEIIDDGLEDWIINRKVKNLFVFDISRLSRKGETFNQYLNLMSNNGVELFTIDGKVDKVDKRIEQLCMGIMKKKLKRRKNKMISLTKNLEEPKSDNMNDKIMSRKEVIEYMGISPSTLYRICDKDKILDYSRINRRKLFYKSNVDKLMERYSSSNLTS